MTDDHPPVRSLSDLERFWRFVKGPWGFSQPQLFCALLGPGGVHTSIIVNIDDCAEPPDGTMLDHLFGALARVVGDVAPGGSVALMFARPGGDELRETDRRWTRLLAAAGHRATIDVWPVFVANDVDVRMPAPDDLAA